ncbi:MAG: hypothetical protein AAF429_13955 [Pseudomonadota bacterium]
MLLLFSATLKAHIMTDTEAEVSDLQAQYERASKYLKRFEKKLFLAIERLEKGSAPEACAKDLEQVVAKLEKVAFKLFEIGYKLEDQHRKRQPATGVLDLDAARDEILGRLARARERQNAKEAAENK